MKCNKTSNQLVAYALGELSEREWQQIQEHLSACASCREMLHAQERTLAALSNAPAPAPTPEMQRDLLRVVSQWLTNSKQKSVRTPTFPIRGG